MPDAGAGRRQRRGNAAGARPRDGSRDSRIEARRRAGMRGPLHQRTPRGCKPGAGGVDERLVESTRTIAAGRGARTVLTVACLSRDGETTMKLGALGRGLLLTALLVVCAIAPANAQSDYPTRPF